MSGFEVGEVVTDLRAGASPVGTVFRHLGDGYFTLVELPPEPLKVGDVIDTAEQAARLPVGSMIFSDDDPVKYAPAFKVAENKWVFNSRYYGPTHDGDNLMAAPHRIVHIPDADAGAGS